MELIYIDIALKYIFLPDVLAYRFCARGTRNTFCRQFTSEARVNPPEHPRER